MDWQKGAELGELPDGHEDSGHEDVAKAIETALNYVGPSLVKNYL